MTLPADLKAEAERLFHVEKWKVGTIARQLGVHRRLVRRALGMEEWRRGHSGPRRSALDGHRSRMEDWLRQYPTLRATRIHDMLVERGYEGSARTVRAYVKQLRPKHLPAAYLEIETLPGEQAQVDWAHVGKLTFPGGQRTLWLFVMVLSHSRALWAEFVLELTASSLARSLCRAATYFGGVPRIWLFDNAKSVVLERLPHAARFHPTLLEVAGALRVQPRLCAPREPTHKGKVERSIRYLRDRFLAGRVLKDVASANAELLAFLETTSGQREHPVDRTITVAEAMAREKPRLLSLPQTMPDTDTITLVRSDTRAFVRFDTNRYSIPPGLVSQTLTLRVSDTAVRVFQDANCVATHTRSYARHSRVELPDHRVALVEQRQEAKASKGQDRLRAAAPHIEPFLEALLEEGHNMGSCTARLLKLLGLYGAPIFNEALQDVMGRPQPSMSAINLACETVRRKHAPNAAVPTTFANHVDDRDVIPNDLEDYDD